MASSLFFRTLDARVWQNRCPCSGRAAIQATLDCAQAASGDDEDGAASDSEEDVDEDDDTIVLTPTGKTAAQLKRWSNGSPVRRLQELLPVHKSPAHNLSTKGLG